MSKEMREQIDKFLNWKQFLNEKFNINPYIYDNPKLVEMIEKVIEPSSFICTYVASVVKMLEGDNVKIYGFSTSENPDATYFVEENGEDSDEGHHFSVMNNRYIIDPWVFDNFNRSVFDLQNKNDEEIVRYLYGDRNKWTDITNRVENFKDMFPKTYDNLLKFYKNIIKENKQNISITDIIKNKLKKWEDEYDIKTCDINTGDCLVFAESLESDLKRNGYYDVEVLTTDLFYDLANSDEYDENENDEIWSKEEDYNSFKPKGFRWVKNGYHGWVYVNGKHYDAEEVNGVINFYDLPIFKRYIGYEDEENTYT